MAKKYYSTLTKIGLNAIARATTMNEKVKFSKFCIGDAEINPDVTTTALGHEVWQGSLSSIVVDENNPNWIVLTCIISATVGGFTIREVGIKDEDGNLLAVASYPETYKPILAEGAGKDLIVRVILEVSNTECVELKIDPTVTLATRSDLEAIENKKADKEEVKKLEEKVEKVEQKVTEGVENLDVSGKQIEFAEAATRTLPKTGDTLKVIVAKLTKYLKDLKTVAFTGKYSDLTGIPASFPPAAHNHDDIYLGKLAKAANSEKLDGHDSSHFATAAQLQEVFQSVADGKSTLISAINKILGYNSGLATQNTWSDFVWWLTHKVCNTQKKEGFVEIVDFAEKVLYSQAKLLGRNPHPYTRLHLKDLLTNLEGVQSRSWNLQLSSSELYSGNDTIIFPYHFGYEDSEYDETSISYLQISTTSQNHKIITFSGMQKRITGNDHDLPHITITSEQEIYKSLDHVYGTGYTYHRFSSHYKNTSVPFFIYNPFNEYFVLTGGVIKNSSHHLNLYTASGIKNKGE